MADLLNYLWLSTRVLCNLGCRTSIVNCIIAGNTYDLLWHMADLLNYLWLSTRVLCNLGCCTSTLNRVISGLAPA